MTKTFKSYDILKNKHAGDTAFVCGAGTSLFDLMKHAYSMIYTHVVISVNSNILMHPWEYIEQPNKCYWISNDSAVMHWDYWDKVKKSNITKIFRDSWMKYADKIPDDFLVFSPRENDHEPLEGEDGLCYTSSVPTGIDLAIQMGCKEIYLLGVDHYVLPNGKSHFWELWPKEHRPISTQFRMPISKPAPIGMQQRVFKDNLKVYKNLRDLSEKLGVKIYNCSSKSAIGVFDKVEFNEIF